MKCFLLVYSFWMTSTWEENEIPLVNFCQQNWMKYLLLEIKKFWKVCKLIIEYYFSRTLCSLSLWT